MVNQSVRYTTLHEHVEYISDEEERRKLIQLAPEYAVLMERLHGRVWTLGVSWLLMMRHRNPLDTSMVLAFGGKESANDASVPLLVGTGLINVYPTSTGLEAHFDDIVVAQSHEGRGVGSGITASLEGIARKHDCRRVRFTSSTKRERAHRMYLALGYVRINPATFEKILAKE